MNHRGDNILKSRFERFTSHVVRFRFRYLSFSLVLTVFVSVFNAPWKNERSLNLTGYKASCIESSRSGTEMLFVGEDGSKYKTFGFRKCEFYSSRVSGQEVVGDLHRAGWGIVSLQLNNKLIHQSHYLVWVMTAWWSGLVWSLGYAAFSRLRARNNALQADV